MYKRIKYLREKNSFTEREVAEAIGVTQRKYCLIETGKQRLATHIIIALAKFYNVSIDYILELTDTAEPHMRK